VQLDAGRLWRARLGLIVLFALFFVPIIGSMVLVVVKPGWTPFGTVNLGELIQPPVTLSLDRTRTLRSAKTLPEQVSGHWNLVHISEGRCAAACESALVAMRQARLALGKEADRVTRIWLVTDPEPAVRVRSVLSEFPGLTAFVAASELLEQFKDRGADTLFVVDPAGLLILRYQGPETASHLHKDMKRLLKISKQG
jgi:hypothetical protein